MDSAIVYQMAAQCEKTRLINLFNFDFINQILHFEYNNELCKQFYSPLKTQIADTQDFEKCFTKLSPDVPYFLIGIRTTNLWGSMKLVQLPILSFSLYDALCDPTDVIWKYYI